MKNRKVQIMGDLKYGIKVLAFMFLLLIAQAVYYIGPIGF